MPVSVEGPMAGFVRGQGRSQGESQWGKNKEDTEGRCPCSVLHAGWPHEELGSLATADSGLTANGKLS